MSREVNLEQELSDRDRKYLEDRGRWSDIAAADGIPVEDVLRNLVEYGNSAGRSARSGDEKASEPGDAATARAAFDSDEEWVESLNVEQLRAEIKQREPGATFQGLKKSVLQDRLLDLVADEEVS